MCFRVWVVWFVWCVCPSVGLFFRVRFECSGLVRLLFACVLWFCVVRFLDFGWVGGAAVGFVWMLRAKRLGF